MSAGSCHALTSTELKHLPVLLQETVEALQVRADGVYVDATFGRGGHSRAVLARLGAGGRLIALDRDLAAMTAARAIADTRFVAVHGPFSGLGQTLTGLGVGKVDGIVLDLGISSPQVEDAARGFSFRHDGPLDMRMDQSHGETAADFIARVSEQTLAEILRNYGEERWARRIARAIVAARAEAPLVTTGRLAHVVASAVPRREPGQDPATRTFQALRIVINGELEELSATLPQCADALAPGGRLAVISFHSLEDRTVKHFIRDQQHRDDLPRRFPVRASALPEARLFSVGRAIRPSVVEVAANPRARSATLRVAERTAAP